MINNTQKYDKLYLKYKKKYLSLKYTKLYGGNPGAAEQSQKINVPIILSIGPIGSGKSTTSTILESFNKEKFRHIDADILDLGSDIVYSLGIERNDYTNYKIVESINDGKIPIVSLGGGQIVNQRGEVTLIKYLDEIYNKKILMIPIIILPVMDNGFKILECDELSVFIDEFNSNRGHYYDLIGKTYHDEERFRRTYEQRKETTPFDRFFKRNTENFGILSNIIKSLQGSLIKIILTPITDSEDYSTKIEETKRILAENISHHIDFEFRNEPKMTDVPNFTQKRLLVDYTLDDTINFHHVTLKFDTKRKILIDKFHDQLIGNQNIQAILMVCPEKEAIDYLIEIREQINLIIDGKYDSLIEQSGFKMSEINKLKPLSDNIDMILENVSLLESLDDKLFKPLLQLRVKLDNESELFMNLNKFKLPCNFKNVKKIKFIIFSEEFNFDKELYKKVHITVDPGVHTPDKMGIAAGIVYNKGPIIVLDEFDKKTRKLTGNKIEYLYGKGNNITCNFHKIFYI
jgi:hypothetical protein